MISQPKKFVDFSRVQPRTENLLVSGRDVPGPGAYEVEAATKGFTGERRMQRAGAPPPRGCQPPVLSCMFSDPPAPLSSLSLLPRARREQPEEARQRALRLARAARLPQARL